VNLKAELPIIGWREWLVLPDLGIPGIKAKVDTGARSSALHTHDHTVYTENGVDLVRFHLHPLRSTNRIALECVAPVSDFREVKDSGGHPEQRVFIRPRVQIGDITWEIDLSLTNREGMRFRMLLGRSALANRFVVHPSKSYLLAPRLHHVYKR
jgi:hypothetical protein